MSTIKQGKLSGGIPAGVTIQTVGYRLFCLWIRPNSVHYKTVKIKALKLYLPTCYNTTWLQYYNHTHEWHEILRNRTGV